MLPQGKGEQVKVGYLVSCPRMNSAMALVLETNPSQDTCETLGICPTVAKVKFLCDKKGVQWTPLEYLRVVNESR